MENYEEVSDLTLADADRDALLKIQNECVFSWRTADGWPIGVVMSYVWCDGKVWLTASSQRPRVKAVRRDDRVSVAISSAGTRMPAATVTIKGRCAILDDLETKHWFYPALAAALIPGNEKQQAGFVRMLDSPRRIVMRVTPERFITFDGRKMGQLGISG
ncbi:MAG TPA: pyridoxamine 5'-phosphate oxidase family protein [Candidatus Binataceae bacterium]|nr:pyridoxamine 5'-phosphate oxidase family protein [Candidatus Binataceae bacterium]